MLIKPLSDARRSGLLVMLVFLPSFASAAQCTWNPTIDYSWNDSRNWIGRVPVSGDDVTIGTNATSGPQNFNSLTITGGSVTFGDLNVAVLNLSGGVLNVEACTLDTLNHSGGGLNCETMDLAAFGTWTWTGGYINATTITIPATGVINISGGQVTLGHNTILNNSGTTTISGGPLQGWENSVFNNLPGGKCLLSTATPFTNYYTGNVFNNNGLLESTANPVTLAAWTFNLNKETRCSSGTLEMTSVTNIPDGASLTGTGTISFQGDVRLSGSATTTTGNLVLSSGSLTATDPAQIVGTLNWTGGVIRSNLTVPTGSSLVASGPRLKEFGGVAILDNNGIFRWEGGGAIRCWENVTINNHLGGHIKIAADGTPFTKYYPTGNVLSNDGTLTKTGGAGGIALLDHITYDFKGELKCNNGTIQLDSTANFSAGSTITGSGAVELHGDMHILGACTETIAELRLADGTLTASSPGAFVGTLDWNHGTIVGTLDVPSNSTIVMAGDGERYLATDAVLNVHGILRWLGPAPLRGWDRSILNILPSGTFDVASDGVLLGNYYATNTFNLEGRLVKSAGTGTTDVQFWTIHTSGEIICETGTLAIHAITHLEEGSVFSGAGTTTLGGTNFLDGTTSSTSQVRIASGTFTGNGGVLSGDILWTGGELRGTTLVGTAGHMTVNGSDHKTLATDAILRVAGEVDLDEAAIRGYDRSRIEVLSGARFDVNAAASLTAHYSTNVLNVQTGGSFNATAGSDFSVLGWALNNDGTVTIESSGQAAFHMGGTSTGSFVSQTGGLLIFANGTQTLNAGATSSGPGEVRVTGGALTANDAAIDGIVHIKGGSVGSSGENGVFQLKNGSRWDSGYLFGKIGIPLGNTFRVDGDEGLRLNRGTILTNHGTLRWDGPSPIQAYENCSVINEADGQIEFHADGTPFSDYYASGNTLINRGRMVKVSGDGETTLNELAYQNEGTLAVDHGILAIESPLDLNHGGQITGVGRVLLRSGRCTLNGTTNVSGATLELGGAVIFGHDNGSGTLAGSNIEWSGGYTVNVVNLNGIVTTPGANTKSIGGQSEVRVSGSLTINGSGKFEAYENSVLRVLPAGLLHVTGSEPLTNYYSGNTLVNEGTFRLGSSPTNIGLPWDFVQASSGRLEIEIGGADPLIPEFDRLTINGSATLAGSIVPSLIGSYDPATGTQFQFLSATGGLGGTRFDSVAGNRFSTSTDGNTALLTALEESYDYDTWAADHQLTGADADQSANPDHDSYTNLEEYAFNLDPNKPDVLEGEVSIMQIDSQQWLVLPYRTWLNRITAGLVYRSVTSSDLQTWDRTGIVDEPDPTAAAIEGSEARRARIPVTPGKQFLGIEAYFPSDG